MRKIETIILLLVVFVRMTYIIFKIAFDITIIPNFDKIWSAILDVILLYFAIRYYQLVSKQDKDKRHSDDNA